MAFKPIPYISSLKVTRLEASENNDMCLPNYPSSLCVCASCFSVCSCFSYYLGGAVGGSRQILLLLLLLTAHTWPCSRGCGHCLASRPWLDTGQTFAGPWLDLCWTWPSTSQNLLIKQSLISQKNIVQCLVLVSLVHNFDTLH